MENEMRRIRHLSSVKPFLVMVVILAASFGCSRDVPIKNPTTAPADFDEQVLRSSVPVVVDFYADWCPPCRVLSPKLAEMATEYSGRIKLVKIDVDVHADLATGYEIKALPTVILFKGGEPVSRWVGLRPVEQYKAVIDKMLSQ
jgi:thioredoxin 1